MNLRIEHFAVNVADPVAIAAWYVEHLGMRVVRTGGAPQHIHFLADAAGATVIEGYNNPVDPIPDYAAMHPMRFHIAFHADSREDVNEFHAFLIGSGRWMLDRPMPVFGWHRAFFTLVSVISCSFPLPVAWLAPGRSECLATTSIR